MSGFHKNIIDLIIVVSAYIFLFTVFPFWLRGFRFCGERVLERLVETSLYAHVVIILCVYLLSLAGIFHRVTLIILLVTVAAAYRLLFKRVQTKAAFQKLSETINCIISGYYHPRVLMWRFVSSIGRFFASLVTKIKNPVGFAFTITIFSFIIYNRSYHSVANMFYGSSDMYLHTEWIKYFMANQPFMAGVYPYGFHNVISAVSGVFGISAVTVMRMFGVVIGVTTVFSLYFILRKTVRSVFAVNFVLTLYAVTDLFPFYATERQFLALPQEFAAVFLYLTAYYLYKYIKNKKSADLRAFMLAVSMTGFIHFFVTIFAALICFAIFISHIVYINRMTFKKIAIAVLCAFFIAVLPLAAGVMRGIELNGSFGWALSVIDGSISETELTAEGDNEEKPESGGIIRRLIDGDYFNPDEPLSLLNLWWFIPYLISAVIGLILPLIKFKQRGRIWIFTGFSLYSLILCVLYVLSHLSVFSLMEYSRLYTFFIYSIPLVLVVPFELIYQLLYMDAPDEFVSGSDSEPVGAGGIKKVMLMKTDTLPPVIYGKIRRGLYLAIAGIISAAGIFVITAEGRLMPAGRVWHSQHNGAVSAYYKIKEEFPRNQWIMVSSMSEYSLCLFDGYHYEIADFVYDLQNNSGEVRLDAENVFIFVVKRPNYYLDSYTVPFNDIPKMPAFDPAEAEIAFIDILDLSENFSSIELYRNYEANRVLQAKAQEWALEYIKYYPNEMCVFYEDDDIIVYRIKQNTYALNNFTIPFRGVNN